MSAQSSPENAPRYEDSAFMRACRGLPNPRTPIWLMRQAGRYMRDYRAVREKVSFIELCRTPDLAAEVAITALDEIGADAAILFSDILLILAADGHGPGILGGRPRSPQPGSSGGGRGAPERGGAAREPKLCLRGGAQNEGADEPRPSAHRLLRRALHAGVLYDRGRRLTQFREHQKIHVC